MQVTEVSADGLKREFTVTVPAGDLEQEITRRLDELGRQVRLPGFRPGKVPMQILRKRFGNSVMGEVLERALSDSSAQAMRDHGLRPALQPKIEIVSFQEGADLEYKMAVELLPEIKPVDFAELHLERQRPEIEDAEIEDTLGRIAQQHRKSELVERAAQTGDEVVLDYVGTIDE